MQINSMLDGFANIGPSIGKQHIVDSSIFQRKFCWDISNIVYFGRRNDRAISNPFEFILVDSDKFLYFIKSRKIKPFCVSIISIFPEWKKVSRNDAKVQRKIRFIAWWWTSFLASGSWKRANVFKAIQACFKEFLKSFWEPTQSFSVFQNCFAAIPK